jgi:hypothetical protein
MKPIIPEEIKSLKDLKVLEITQKEYANWLERIMLYISHDMRQHVVNVLGLSNLLNTTSYSSKQLKQITSFLKSAATSLDVKTRSLSGLIYKKITDLKSR